MLKIAKSQLQSIFAHAERGLPNEACGLLAGCRAEDGAVVRRVYLLTNADASPEHFSMLSEEQFRAVADIRTQKLELLGNFHSHPSTPARPSQEDIRLAFDPSLFYLIISLAEGAPRLRAYRIVGSQVSEEPYKVLAEDEIAI